MNVSEIVITVSLTVVTTAVIAYITFKLQTKHRERVFFRTLLDEVKLNLSLARLITSKNFPAGLRDLGRVPQLHTEVYDNVKVAGELLTLPDNIRETLQYAYEMIIGHNHELLQSHGLGPGSFERVDGIIQRLELLENELAKGVQKPTKISDYAQQDLLRRYIMFQVPPFFFFGLFSIYAHYLSKLDTGTNISIWDWVQHIVGQALMPIGIASIAWAIILFIVGLSFEVPKPLKGMQEKITGFTQSPKNEPIVYVASMVVFGLVFATTWANLSGTGIDAMPLFIIFCIGLALTFGLFVDNILRAWHQRPPKAKTKNARETQDPGA